MDEKSLSHTCWNCKYHIVLVPKYRRKAIYGKLKFSVQGVQTRLKRNDRFEISDRVAN